jgi:hypothetical protein
MQANECWLVGELRRNFTYYRGVQKTVNDRETPGMFHNLAVMARMPN